MSFHQKTVPVDRSFKDPGSVSCSVLTGTVKIVVNGQDVGVYGGTPQAISSFYSTSKSGTKMWRVEVRAISQLAEVSFNSP